MERIEVDEEVYEFLRSRIINFGETPNAVLRRELGLDTSLTPMTKTAPAALTQVIEVVSIMRRNRLSRIQATIKLANQLGVARETIGDKYGRQLELTTSEFDRLANEPSLRELSQALIRKFPRHEAAILQAIRRIVMT